MDIESVPPRMEPSKIPNETYTRQLEEFDLRI